MVAVDARVEQRDGDAATVGAGKSDAVPAQQLRALERSAGERGRVDGANRIDSRDARALSSAASARAERTAEKPLSVRVKTSARSMRMP